MVLMRSAKWIYVAAGSGIAIGVLNYLQSDKMCVQTSWTTNFEPSVKWDHNWDKRDPSSLIKPAKNEYDPKEQNRINEEKEMLKPKASRHLFLIRHGQYEDKAKHDADRKLTSLGVVQLNKSPATDAFVNQFSFGGKFPNKVHHTRVWIFFFTGQKQAEYVGQRLKELGFNYTKMTHSTMTRAIETSDIILKYFPDIPTQSDSLLREGSPIPPEPPVGSWRPEHQFFKDGPRIEAAFRKYFHRADATQTSPSYEIIVCHANVIRYFVCRALQLPPEAWLNFGLHHCSITWIVIQSSGRVAVNAIGDFGFIPRDKWSS